MKNMWNFLGFRESPYNTNPLRVNKDDVELLIGRGSEANELCTLLESSSHGVTILSGVPGVGKTSFFNVQQYLLETEKSVSGPKALAARNLCPVQPKDSSRTLALRALESLYRSVSDFCTINECKVPKNTKQIGKWLTKTGNSGFSVGISILGCGGNLGRQTELPSVDDVTYQGIADAISSITSEVVNNLGFDCCIIAFDNVENLTESELQDILITFRDTLFTTDSLWWFLIGQSGLGSYIQALDPRVYERISGSGIEMEPLSIEELHEAIDVRVSRFHTSPDGKSLLSSDIHQRLFEASDGEIRFVFKYAGSICTRYIERLRENVIKILEKEEKKVDRKSVDAQLMATIGDLLVQYEIPSDAASQILTSIVKSEFEGLSLKTRENAVLHQIGKLGKARPKDFSSFGMSSAQEFYSNYISKLYQQKLLVREQEGKAVFYRLRGLARMAYQCGLIGRRHTAKKRARRS